MRKSEFTLAAPSKKPVVIRQGFDFMVTSIDTMTLNLKTLNTWLAGYPELMKKNEASMPDANTIVAYEDFVRACDTLTSQIVASAEHMQRVMDTTKSLNNGSTNKIVPGT